MTIKDIARMSGVGVATVSRVLNNHPDVSEDTRRKVMAVVEAQGFQPNNNARRLKQQTVANSFYRTRGGTPPCTIWTRTPTRWPMPPGCAGSVSLWASCFWGATWSISKRNFITSSCPACCLPTPQGS